MGADTKDYQRATDYLLMNNLNLLTRAEEGQAGNRRLTSLLWDILHRLRPTVFCDIGAFDGSTALAAKQKFPELLVYSFEANPEVFALHAPATAAAGVKYLNLAISDAVGVAKIYAPRTLTRYYAEHEVRPGRIVEPTLTRKASLLLRNEEAVYEEFEVAATTLDAFFTKEAVDVTEHRIVLWIDAEGAADIVLRGAERTLRDTVAVFVETENFEFWKEEKDSADITRDLIGRGFIPIARDREYGDHQFNILFVKAALMPHIMPELFDAQSPLRSCTISSEHQPIARCEPRKGGHCSSIGEHFQRRIPIMIPVFNSVTHLRMMVSQLLRRDFREIVVIDNASTFPPMLAYLSQIESDISVIRLDQNKGPRSIFIDKKSFLALPQFFCVTDPDLEFNTALPDDFLCELISLTEEHQVGKAGLALDISDRSAMRDEDFQVGAQRYRIWEWEAQFWQNRVGSTSTGDEVYDALIDTTFAVYNKRFFNPTDYLKAVRVGGKYTCRHLPWYKNRVLPQEEEEFYRANQKHSHYVT